RSHSGYFKNRKWSGHYDEHWLKALPQQLIRRGWSIGKGKTYLSKHGIDGRYGAEYEQLIRAFQREQGIPVDGLGGEQVWREAFHRPCHDCRTRGLDGPNRCARGAGDGDRHRGGEDRHVPVRPETADGASPIDGHENETRCRAADICSRYQAGRYRRVGEPAE